MKSNRLYRILGIMSMVYGISLLLFMAFLTFVSIDMSHDLADLDILFLVVVLVLALGGSSVLYFAKTTLPRHRAPEHWEQLILDFPQLVADTYKVTTRLWISGVLSIIAAFLGSIGFSFGLADAIESALRRGWLSQWMGLLAMGIPAVCALALLVYSIRTMTLKHPQKRLVKRPVKRIAK